MFTFEVLLSTYDAFQQQKTIEVSDRLRRLHQQMSSQLLTIRQEEHRFITAQQNILDLLRPHLATDARSLLTTPQFREFVRALLQPVETGAIDTACAWQLASTPDQWQLGSLPVALQLKDIELLPLGDADAAMLGITIVQLQVVLGEWQHRVQLPNHPVLPKADGVAGIGRILTPLLSTAILSGVDAHTRESVIQELACVLGYVSSLFHLDPMAASLDCFSR